MENLIRSIGRYGWTIALVVAVGMLEVLFETLEYQPIVINIVWDGDGDLVSLFHKVGFRFIRTNC